MAGHRLLPPNCDVCDRVQAVMGIGDSRMFVCPVCAISLDDPCPYLWRPYPILDVDRRHKDWNSRWPTYFPWGLLWPHERQAIDNHGQTLRRLAERGGLSVVEMLFIIEGRTWKNAAVVTMAEAMRRLRTYRIHWMRRNPKPKGTDR